MRRKKIDKKKPKKKPYIELRKRNFTAAVAATAQRIAFMQIQLIFDFKHSTHHQSIRASIRIRIISNRKIGRKFIHPFPCHHFSFVCGALTISNNNVYCNVNIDKRNESHTSFTISKPSGTENYIKQKFPQSIRLQNTYHTWTMNNLSKWCKREWEIEREVSKEWQGRWNTQRRSQLYCVCVSDIKLIIHNRFWMIFVRNILKTITRPIRFY